MALCVWLYRGAYCQPNDAIEMADENAEWTEALSSPQVMTPEEKTRSIAVCGARFRDGATSKNQAPDNLLACTALVLDVDYWRTPEHPELPEPFAWDALCAKFAGMRAIVWTTFSSTAERPKYRVVIPFLHELPPTKYRALWRLLNAQLDGAMAPVTSDPGRLGFLASVGSETGLAAYRWAILPGDPLDWHQLEDVLPDEASTALPRALKPADMSQSPDWTSRTTALAACKRYFQGVGVEVPRGERHNALLRASCRVWWDWAAPDEEFTREVLTAVNDTFAEPKAPADVEAEIAAGYERTLGEHRVLQPVDYGVEREPQVRATLTGLKDRAALLKRRSDERARTTGRALAAVAQGHRFAEPIEARTLALQVAEEVARTYPREAAERLLDLMRPALGAQRSLGGALPTEEEILAKIRWQQTAMRKRADEKEAHRKDQVRQAISHAFGGTRDTPYTVQERRQWEATGFDDSQWVLQRERDFYFFVNGDYVGPYGERAAGNHAHVALAPAAEWVKTTYLDSKTGAVRFRMLDDLMRDYGSVVARIDRSLVHDRAEYCEPESRLVMPMCRVRKLTAAYDEEIDAWLQVFAGAQYDALCDWLAVVPQLDRAAAALVMVTRTGSGKNLLACGISRLWSEADPPRLATWKAVDLEISPVVFCDEHLPASWARCFTSQLREFVSAGGCCVDRPHMGRFAVRGYRRLVLAANNYDILGVGATASAKQADLHAIAERLLMVQHMDAGPDGQSAACAYLTRLGPKVHTWVTEDKIARHMLWLRDNRLVGEGRRFGIPVQDVAAVGAMLTVSDPVQCRLLEWVLTFLQVLKFPSIAVVAHEGQLFLHAPTMADSWKTYDDKSTLRLRDITLAIAALAPDRRRLQFTADTPPIWFRRLDMQRWGHWLRESGADADTVAEAIHHLEGRRACTII